MGVEFIKSKVYYAIGVFREIKSRDEVDSVLKEVDKKVNTSFFHNYDKVIYNFGKGFKSEDIFCFIGRVIPDYEAHLFELTVCKKNKDLVIMSDNDKFDNMLHATVNGDIANTYHDIIKYASKNNIQIRGAFQEIYSHKYFEENGCECRKSQIDIYVEAYDLNIENEMEIAYREKLGNKLSDIYPDKFIGKWELGGEITEIPRAFNPRKKHYMPDTNLKSLVLYKDGKTNFDNISWKENYLIINDDDTVIYNHMYIKKYGMSKYLEILINSKESNARPYKFFYKKMR